MGGMELFHWSLKGDGTKTSSWKRSGRKKERKRKLNISYIIVLCHQWIYHLTDLTWLPCKYITFNAKLKHIPTKSFNAFNNVIWARFRSPQRTTGREQESRNVRSTCNIKTEFHMFQLTYSRGSVYSLSPLWEKNGEQWSLRILHDKKWWAKETNKIEQMPKMYM